MVIWGFQVIVFGRGSINAVLDGSDSSTSMPALSVSVCVRFSCPCESEHGAPEM